MLWRSIPWAVLAYLALVQVALADRNRAQNGGFEYGYAFWTSYVWPDTVGSDGTYKFASVSGGEQHGGSWAVRISCVGSRCGGGSYRGALFQWLDAEPDTRYVVSGFVRTDAPGERIDVAAGYDDGGSDGGD